VTSSAVDWDTLTRLVAGEVVVPGSPGYDAVRKPAMARFHDVRPAAVVRCRTPGHLYARSEFFRRPLDRQTLQALAREVTFLPWGGGYNQVAPDATAFPHRNELFLIQHLLEADPGTAAAHR